MLSILIIVILISFYYCAKKNKNDLQHQHINNNNLNYHQQLNNIAKLYFNKYRSLSSYCGMSLGKGILYNIYKNRNYINDEDISSLVEIIKNDINISIEDLWNQTEEKLIHKIIELHQNEYNLENKRKQEIKDLENQIKKIKKQSLINNLKQQGKRKKQIVKQNDDLISLV